ncbi:hypothetical protein D3C72_1529360 [compost metagenome]
MTLRLTKCSSFILEKPKRKLFDLQRHWPAIILSFIVPGNGLICNDGIAVSQSSFIYSGNRGRPCNRHTAMHKPGLPEELARNLHRKPRKKAQSPCRVLSMQVILNIYWEICKAMMFLPGLKMITRCQNLVSSTLLILSRRAIQMEKGCQPGRKQQH